MDGYSSVVVFCKRTFGCSLFTRRFWSTPWSTFEFSQHVEVRAEGVPKPSRKDAPMVDGEEALGEENPLFGIVFVPNNIALKAIQTPMKTIVLKVGKSKNMETTLKNHTSKIFAEVLTFRREHRLGEAGSDPPKWSANFLQGRSCGSLRFYGCVSGRVYGLASLSWMFVQNNCSFTWKPKDIKEIRSCRLATLVSWRCIGDGPLRWWDPGERSSLGWSLWISGGFCEIGWVWRIFTQSKSFGARHARY